MDRPLLPLRTALVFLLAVLSGVTTGVLSWLAGESIARSLLAGLAATGLSIPFFDRLITREGADDACEKAQGHG
ncbi:hypothetical protein [Streptomyces sp. NPDC054887]